MSTKSTRLLSIDILRGIVISLMAIDHIRDFWAPTSFSPEDMDHTSPELFLTRWITHFCAPVFVFLAGTSAFLYSNNGRSKMELSRFLMTRGLFLVVLELAIINPSWAYNWNFPFVQVIWALGWSMISLSALIWLPRWSIATLAILMIFGHNLTDSIHPQTFGDLAGLWVLLHVNTWLPLGQQGFGVMVLYPLIPWIGVMAAGYLLGPVFLREETARHRALYFLGGLLVALYVFLRLSNVYGDPNPWEAQDRGLVFTTLEFLNATKYPASLQFLCMTLGPALLLLPLLERLQGRVAETLLVFGQVPLFFYVIHVPVIHLSASLRNILQYGRDFGFFTGPPNSWPESYEPSVLQIYVVWVLLMIAFYLPCRWYRDLKFRQRKAWMSYL